jgi:nucleoside-diphosphate-sugar epimerase
MEDLVNSRDTGNPLAEDLDGILDRTTGLWDELRGQRIFITGGTGFFGCWLLESFAWANDRLSLGASAMVLTRDAAGFRQKASHLASHPAIAFLQGDVRTFAFPEGEFSHVIHAATEASATLNEQDPLQMLDTVLAGTKRTLDLARQAGARRFLLASSGAVYGRQPPELTRIPEEYTGGPDPLDRRSAYGEGKRLAELLCSLYACQHGLEAKIARCFAFVGPYLPLERHFAIGNFIRDGLRGGPIRVNGDGTPYRSYLYAADLAVWLWTILLKGQSCRAYNVGSEDALTIAEVARVVGDSFAPRHEVRIAGVAVPGRPAERYVPSVFRAGAELGLGATCDVGEAVRRTACWYRGAAMRSGGWTRSSL